MQAYSGFQKQINELLNSDSSSTQRSIIIKELEKGAFDLCLLFDTKIQSVQNDLLAKNNELIKVMEERFSLAQKLNRTKDSARAIIKCLNLSIKASSHVIARTIIEMIAREHVHAINLTIRKFMEKFRREKKISE
jgi:hypothetical protein